jgi:hypothetical protein
MTAGEARDLVTAEIGHDADGVSALNLADRFMWGMAEADLAAWDNCEYKVRAVLDLKSRAYTDTGGKISLKEFRKAYCATVDSVVAYLNARFIENKSRPSQMELLIASTNHRRQLLEDPRGVFKTDIVGGARGAGGGGKGSGKGAGKSAGRGRGDEHGRAQGDGCYGCGQAGHHYADGVCEEGKKLAAERRAERAAKHEGAKGAAKKTAN